MRCPYLASVRKAEFDCKYDEKHLRSLRRLHENVKTRLVHVHFYIHTLNPSGRFGSPLASINTAINVKFLEKD